jgi:hypothetical protein
VLLPACLVIVGGVLSVTVKQPLVVALLPQASFAVKITVIAPQLGAVTLQS